MVPTFPGGYIVKPSFVNIPNLLNKYDCARTKIALQIHTDHTLASRGSFPTGLVAGLNSPFGKRLPGP